MIQKDAHREELIGRLRVLRADIDVIMDRYRMNCVSRIEEILRILEHRDIIGDSTVEPSVQDMQSMLTMLDGTKLKPKKARLKDLKRVDALLKQLLSQFPTQI